MKMSVIGRSILTTIKNWGWACEQIAGVDVVTAAGEALYCSEKENSELFGCARGAGPGKEHRIHIS